MTPPDPFDRLALLRRFYGLDAPAPAVITPESRKALIEAVTGFQAGFAMGLDGKLEGVVAAGLPVKGAGGRVPLKIVIKFSEE